MAKTVVVIGGGVIGLTCAYALTDAGCEVTVVDAGELAGGASRGNAGWVTPSLATPLAAPGILTSGLRSALDPKGALVIRPSLDTAWLRWLWSFRRAARPEQFSAGVQALLGMTRRTLEELDAYRAAGLAFEEHRDGIIAVARDRSAFHWFDDTFAELARYGFEGELHPPVGRRGARRGAGAGRHRRRRHPDDDRPARRSGEPRARARHPGRPDHRARAGVGDRPHRRRLARPRRHRVARRRRRRRRHRHRRAGAAAAVRRRRCRSWARRATRSRRPAPGTAPSSALYLCEPKLGLSALGAGLRIAGMFELGRTDGAVHRRPHPPAGRRHAAVPARLAARARLGGDRLGRLPARDARQPADDRRGARPARPLRRRRPRHARGHARARHRPCHRGARHRPAVPDWVAPFAVDRPAP